MPKNKGGGGAKGGAKGGKDGAKGSSDGGGKGDTKQTKGGTAVKVTLTSC